MANEDTLNDQGDIAARVTYDPRNVPRGSGYMSPQQISQAPAAPPVSGWTSPAIITDTARIVLPADPNRKFILIQNADPAGNIFIAFGVDASLAIGIKASSGGGGILLDNNVPTAAVSIIGDIPLNPNVTIVSA